MRSLSPGPGQCHLWGPGLPGGGEGGIGGEGGAECGLIGWRCVGGLWGVFLSAPRASPPVRESSAEPGPGGSRCRRGGLRERTGDGGEGAGAGVMLREGGGCMGGDAG